VGSAADPGIDELYAGDPDQFVARRQALVKQLKAAGDRERAAEVAGLRRPTVAAWAVNQLARRHPDQVAHLLELGQELEEAHEGLLGGARPDSAVAAGRRRREAISALTDAAVALLAESGRSPDAHRDAIADTLDAASLDPRSGAVVRAGRLTRELDPPSGFGLDWAPDDWSPPPRRTAEPQAADAAGPAGEESGGTEAEDRRAAQAAAAEAAATAAQEEAAAAARAAAEAEERVEQLENDLEEAKAAARVARRASADAAARARKAKAAATAASEASGAAGAGAGWVSRG
jgi:hypothetical protein